MALFEYFPNNYIWNLSLAIALSSGAEMGELLDMCRPLQDAAKSGADAGTAQFMAEWVRTADKLIELAREDQDRGRNFSACSKLQRASLYLITAERMQGHGHPDRAATYGKAQACLRDSLRLGKLNCEPLEIPYGSSSLPALLTRAPEAGTRAPCVLYVNGLDSCKELLYWSGLPQALARRGISTVCEQARRGPCACWHRGDLAGRTFRPPGVGVRTALRQWSGLGSQPQLGRSAAEPPAPRG
jgi:hypothetical protein